MAGALSVRKTLVIGLGSTGLHVAEQLAEHLNWQYGSFERAAWLRLLVLETAQPQSPLGDRVLWSGMTKEEYQPYLNSPRTSGSEFGFYDWQDGPTLRDIDNPSDGAGNCRMLGRLCLFHPRNYENIRRRATADISHLQGLTPQGVADSLGESGLQVNIHEGGTVVYIVGTLCGGTCSGGAADLGYLIDAWSGNSVRRQAIFTVPHPALAHTLAARYKKNAYYALKELNHFQLGSNRWSQRLPSSDTPFVNDGRPYDILRIVMPGGPSQEDVKRLNAMIAQYLAAAVGPAGFEIAASDVDATGKMAGTESVGFMRPLFSTTGVAALEYPGEHIQRAATSRLLAATYGRWLRHQTDSPEFLQATRAIAGGDFEGVLQRLLEGTEGFANELRAALEPARGEGEPPEAEAIRKLLRDLEARFAAQEAPGAEGAATNTLAPILTRNGQGLVEAVAREVQRAVEGWLLRLEGGPGFVKGVIDAAQREMDGWSATVASMQPAARQDADSLRGMRDDQLAGIEEIEGKLLVWNKREKLRDAWEAAIPQLEAYLAAELRAQALSHLQRRDLLREPAEQLRKVTAIPARRLESISAAFEQETSVLDRAWREMSASSPSVNGKVYFEPEPPAATGTVTDEYYKLLRQRRWPNEPVTGWDDGQKEAAAMADVLRSLEPLRQELAREEGQGAFDPRPGSQTARERIPPAVLATADGAARTFFSALREQTHIADKAGPSDVDTVVQASEPKLAISAAQVSDQLSGVRGVAPMHSYLAFLDLGPNPDRPSNAIAEMAQRVRHSIELRRGITNSRDPYRLLLLREKHGFTLGQMEGIVRAHANDNHALQSAESCPDFKFWHTRRDVDWVDPLVPPGQVEDTEEAWLLALLLGRPADPALPWLPSTKGEIEKDGWYQLVAGAFYVYYAQGADATERGANLPLSFPVAIAKLLTTDYALLRRTLRMRFTTFCGATEPGAVVRVVDQALRSLAVFGVSELDYRTAERIVRRAYRRNDTLTRAFFDYKTAGLTDPAEFAHLRRLQGEPIENQPGQLYPADGYYCPKCHHLLGGGIQNLLEGQFLCPRCNTGERYWP